MWIIAAILLIAVAAIVVLEVKRQSL